MNKFKKIIISSTLALITALSLLIVIGQFKVSLNTYTLQKDNQTIILQEMSHIAEPSFYNHINQNISKFKDLGYIHLYEGLYIKDKKHLAILNDLIGFNLSLGKSIGNASGLSSQNDQLDIDYEDVRADTDSETIIKEFEKRKINNNEIKILDSIKKIENNEFNRWLIKSLLRTGLRIHKTFGEDIIMLDGMKEIILKGRNKVVLQYINDFPEDNIFLTYGAAHIDEIKETLENQGYKLIKTEKIEVF